MFYCRDCGYTFDNPKRIIETHNLTNPPFEKIYVCPKCNSNSISERVTHYCRYCGRTLKFDGANYCNDSCKRAGERLWNKQLRRKIREESNELNLILRETEKYNKEHGTKLSYGQYVASHSKKVKK